MNMLKYSAEIHWKDWDINWVLMVKMYSMAIIFPII